MNTPKTIFEQNAHFFNYNTETETPCLLIYDSLMETLIITDEKGHQLQVENGYTDFVGITHKLWEKISQAEDVTALIFD